MAGIARVGSRVSTMSRSPRSSIDYRKSSTPRTSLTDTYRKSSYSSTASYLFKVSVVDPCIIHLKHNTMNSEVYISLFICTCEISETNPVWMERNAIERILLIAEQIVVVYGYSYNRHTTLLYFQSLNHRTKSHNQCNYAAFHTLDYCGSLDYVIHFIVKTSDYPGYPGYTVLTYM